MEASESGHALAALGEDLFLLSIRPRDGKLLTWGRIDLGLMGSELVRLAAAGRAGIAEGRIVVLDRTAAGDAELDAALLSLTDARVPPRPETWVGLPRRGIRDAYAARLMSAGVLRARPSRILGTSRYVVIDSSRVAAARSRLDAITQSTGPPADPAQAALGGLACAIGLGGVLYPGRPGRERRERMGEIARQAVLAHAEADADLAALAGAQEAVAAAVHAVTAVIESGAVISSQVLGTHGPGDHGASHHGGDGHHAGAHGDGGHMGGFGGFGHH